MVFFFPLGLHKLFKNQIDFVFYKYSFDLVVREVGLVVVGFCLVGLGVFWVLVPWKESQGCLIYPS